VRHGQLASDAKTIQFQDRCGLKMKDSCAADCTKIPFPKGFNYFECDVYLNKFKTPGMRNDVMPTSDFQYSDALSPTSITDMELL
jgi:hypothetical protein